MNDFLSSLVYILEANFILFICQIFTILVVLKLIVDKKSASNILAWILAILFIPYIAIPFFFIFQRKGARRFWQKKTMDIYSSSSANSYLRNDVNEELPKNVVTTFSNLKLPTLTMYNSFEIYTDGVRSFKAFIKAINSATKSIYIQTYILKNDATSKLILNALEKKAAEGVEIKILIDSLGSLYVYFHNKRIFRNLRALGAEIAFFMPILTNPLRNYINYRNHRKIFIFDNNLVMSGGINIGDEYMSPMYHDGMWSDLLFSLQGESILHFLNVFCSDWYFATNQELDFKLENNIHEKCFTQIVPSGPDRQKNELYAGLITAINSAQEKLWIITPYLIPSIDLLQAITLAKYRGVDVKVITPKNSDHKIINRARSSYIRDLLSHNIEVHFTEKMIHAKAILIDSNIAILGSINLDNRSLFLNYELATFVYTPNQVKKLYLWAENILKDSSQNSGHLPTKKSSLIVESIMKILTPLM
ncbi:MULTISPECIES: phospholipase D-like domain-containing protein [unclassified Francisella]|uniref:phospholipase D-like domain-containing protein n=1 Tax=unclassified Francisella TaxID=2610885 RepID=UPI002E32928C|nr:MULTISPECIES: phospholipase D-like domain-containing protein [unclassified Francisella]MED7818439.1 phospholipase D-like domain-containing protein [Francisella sp. 19S2-4]MED7829306.1 phospholipase D-like domain-containing protein [Francisella sp. 19S2-10]